MSTLPEVSPRYAALPIVLASILTQACAAGPKTPGPAPLASSVLKPGSVWSFSATAEAANVYLNQRSVFSVLVSGELTILAPDSASIASTHGTCLAHAGRGVRIQRNGIVSRIRCGNISLELTDGVTEPMGSVSVVVDEEYTSRGSCLDWKVDPETGRRLSCITYDELVSRRKVWTRPVPVVFSR